MDNIEQDGLRFQDNPKLDLSRFFQNKFNVAIVASLVFGVLLLVAGGWFFVASDKSSNDDIKIISGQKSSEAPSSQILVHVDGAVVKPGVYQLKPDARVNDAIAAAGGLTANAERSKINLAAKLSDGQKVYVAKLGEGTGGTISTKSTGGSTGSVAGSESSGLVSINSASQSELDSLPGVGPVTVNKIIAGRPYSSPDELVSKKAVGKAEFEKIKDLISL